MPGDNENDLGAGCSGSLTKPVHVDNPFQVLVDAHKTVNGERDNGAEIESRPDAMQALSEPLSPIISTLPMDRPGFRAIVERFHTKLLNKLDEMEAALAADDLEALGELAHWLKGSGGTIGYDCLTEPARRLEQLAKQQNTDGLADGLRELKNLAERITGSNLTCSASVSESQERQVPTDRVLIVDDDTAILALYALQLGKEFDIDTAGNAERGLSLVASRGPYAVVVADKHMPGMSGGDFLCRIGKSSPQTTRIMLTADGLQAIAAEAANDGQAFRFLNKPCPANELATAVRDGIGRYNLLRRAQSER